MHYLDRSRVAAPGCLRRYDPNADNWRKLAKNMADYGEVCAQLHQLQGLRCAYCESDLEKVGRHVEHFRQRSKSREDTFEWSNLFWSCDRKDRCGRYKDTCTYVAGDLIKPDVDDPEDFFVFVRGGTIAIREGLSALDSARASETIRVFKLDEENGPLRWARHRATEGYVQTAEGIADMAAEYDESDWLPVLLEELDAIRDLPYATAIRHVLTSAGS